MEIEKNGSKKKTDGKLKELSCVVSAIDVSPIKKMELLCRETPGAVSLAQGIPSFETPLHIKEAVKSAIDKDLCNRYTPGYGIDPLRQAIVEKLKRDNQIEAKPTQIVATHGAIQALMAIFITLLDPEDELIVLSPDYATHISQAIIACKGKKPVQVPLAENEGWSFSAERLEAAITDKSKAILLCNPSNPTGKVYSEDELKQIAAIAKKHELFIIVDEIYEYFTYEGKKHVSIGSFPEVADQVISVFGVSKSYAMTGWRIGYLVATEELAYEIFKVHDSLVTCPTAVSQYAAIAALNGPQDERRRFAEEFAKRRGIVTEALEGNKKLKMSAPDGAYYAFIRVEGEQDDFEFAKRLLKEAQVAVIPGSAFGLGGEGHVRVSFGVTEERLKEGLRRLIKF